MINLLEQAFILSLTAEAEKQRPFGVDMSIESMNNQVFSTAMFYFLVFAICVFVVIAFMFMLKGKTKNIKRGEKFLFGMIMAGVVVAIFFGAAQMLHGFLI